MALFQKKSGGATKEKREKTPAGMALANNILLAPRITEKSYLLSEKNQYVFQVAVSANKNEVRRVIEEVYGVRVTQVQTISIQSRKRAFGRTMGKKGKMKKAIVTLVEGDKIEMFQSPAA